MSQNMIFRIEYLLFGRRSLQQHMRSHINCHHLIQMNEYERWAREIFPFLCVQPPRNCLFVRRCDIHYNINCGCLCLSFWTINYSDMLATTPGNNKKKYRNINTSAHCFPRSHEQFISFLFIAGCTISAHVVYYFHCHTTQDSIKVFEWNWRFSFDFFFFRLFHRKLIFITQIMPNRQALSLIASKHQSHRKTVIKSNGKTNIERR